MTWRNAQSRFGAVRGRGRQVEEDMAETGGSIYRIGLRSRGLVLLLVSLTLSACFRSKATELYILPSRNPPVAMESATSAIRGERIPCSVSLTIREIKLPDYLSRPEITSVANNGKLIARDFEQWGEPLELGVSRILRSELIHQFPEFTACTSIGHTKTPLAYELSITLTGFEHRIDESKCILNASWNLERNGQPSVQAQFTSEITSAQDPNPSEIAECLADLTGQFAGEVGRVVRGY